METPQAVGLAGLTEAAAKEPRPAQAAAPGEAAPEGEDAGEAPDFSQGQDVPPQADAPSWVTRLAFDETVLRNILQGARPPRLVTPRGRRRRDESGKRSKSRAASSRGRYVRSRPSREYRDLALDATIRSAALRRGEAGGCAGAAGAEGGAGAPLAVHIRREDLHSKVRERKMGNLLVFLVDTSSSMGTEDRVTATQGAILTLLVDAYQRRDRVGLITFRETFAEVILRPTASIERAKQAFEQIYIGGTTPLSAGLAAALAMIQEELVRDPDLTPLLILVTDGFPNIALGPMDPLQEALQIAQVFRTRGIASVVLDTEGGYTKSLLVFSTPGRSPDIARALGAKYIPLGHITQRVILDALRSRLSA